MLENVLKLVHLIPEDAMQKLDEAKEGGADEEKNDISAFSIGDITIDSVKDHLL